MGSGGGVREFQMETRELVSGSPVSGATVGYKAGFRKEKIRSNTGLLPNRGSTNLFPNREARVVWR